MDMILDEVSKPVRITPYMIKNLSQDRNLGDQSLKKSEDKLKF